MHVAYGFLFPHVIYLFSRLTDGAHASILTSDQMCVLENTPHVSGYETHVGTRREDQALPIRMRSVITAE